MNDRNIVTHLSINVVKFSPQTPQFINIINYFVFFKVPRVLKINIIDIHCILPRLNVIIFVE